VENPTFETDCEGVKHCLSHYSPAHDTHSNFGPSLKRSFIRHHACQHTCSRVIAFGEVSVSRIILLRQAHTSKLKYLANIGLKNDFLSYDVLVGTAVKLTFLNFFSGKRDSVPAPGISTCVRAVSIPSRCGFERCMEFADGTEGEI